MSQENLQGEKDRCPYCNSKNVIHSAAVSDGPGMYYPTTCKDCNKKWDETYTIEFSGNWGESKEDEEEQEPK